MATRDTVVVVQKDDHSLGYYDFRSGEPRGRVALPPFPHEFTISRDGRYAYCCHFGLRLAEDDGPGGDEVSVVDLSARRHVRSIALGSWRRPHGIAQDRDGRLYVLSEGASQLLVIGDPQTGRIDSVLPTHGKGSHIVSVTADGRLAFSSNMWSDTVSVMAPHEGRMLAVLPTGRRPEGSAFDDGERRLLVTNRESSCITVFDVSTLRVEGRIAVPPGPVRIAAMGNARFCVALYHDQSVAVVDVERGAVTRRVALPGRPVSMSYHAPSGCALTGLIPSGVAVIDIDRDDAVRIISTAAGPDPIAVFPLEA